MPRRRGVGGAPGARALCERGIGASASQPSKERVCIEPPLSHLADAGAIVNTNEAARVFEKPDQKVVSAGFENVGLEEDLSDAIGVMVVDAPLVLCGALEGDAAHELILIA